MRIIAKAGIYDGDWASYRLLDADTGEDVGIAMCGLLEGVFVEVAARGHVEVGTQRSGGFRMNLEDALQRLGHELAGVDAPCWDYSAPPEWARP